MKSLVNLSIALFAVAAISSCSSAKKFGDMESSLPTDAKSAAAAAALVDFSSTPEVLTLTNGVVGSTLSVKFAPGYFAPKVIAKVTPVIVFAEGEIAGAPFYFQGEDVEDNYTIVPELGGSFTQKVEFPYIDEMRKSNLQLRIELKNTKKATNTFHLINVNTGEVNEGDNAAECGVVVAQGVNTLQQDFNFGALMDVMPNNYKAVTYQAARADIKYAVNSSNVNKSSLSNSQIAAFKEAVEAAKDNSYASQTVSANGYASPDGPEKLNDDLSSARSESAKKALNKFFSEMGLEADAAAYGEDWDGFKELVAASSIQDKNLILQVLSLYDSSTQREAEIKNLSSVYTELKSDILPELRRAQIVSNIRIKGLSDEDMMALVEAKKYSELSQEDLLYLAENVIKDTETKLAVLEYTAKEYNDARAYNNLGVVLAQTGDAEASLLAFQAATRNGASNAIISKNLALANLDNDNYSEAKKFGTDAEAKAAIAAIEGNYTSAAASFKGYNAAIANILNGNYAAAKSAIASCKCAKGNYLRGVIASAEGDIQGGISYIKQAVAAAPEMTAKAKSDVNLANLFEGGLVL